MHSIIFCFCCAMDSFSISRNLVYIYIMKTKLNLLSKELSERLINIGFDYEVDYVYDNDGSIKRLDNFTNDYNGLTPAISAEIATQYLREEHNIDIFMARIGNITMPNIGYSFIIFVDDDCEPKFINTAYETYEEAIIDSIAKTINFINGINEFTPPS